MDENFNSHAHVERDGTPPLAPNTIGISTHTLTWSVTYTILKRISDMRISTHTLTWSVTKSQNLAMPIVSFQLTRSRGA
mgnify:CR=1 FL=1